MQNLQQCSLQRQLVRIVVIWGYRWKLTLFKIEFDAVELLYSPTAHALPLMSNVKALPLILYMFRINLLLFIPTISFLLFTLNFFSKFFKMLYYHI